MVGKYVGYEDLYKSFNEVLFYGGFVNRFKVNIKWIEVEVFEMENSGYLFVDVNGIFVFGGFGDWGSCGMMEVVWIVRE